MTPFITTYTGKKVNPLDLKVSDICMRDIAHQLALLNRFVGCTREPISIAQHSVYVARLCESAGFAREGLCHDIPEAYLGDVSKWVKQHEAMLPYRGIEDYAWITIAQALKIDVNGTPERNPVIRQADDLMVRFEAMHGISNPDHLFSLPTHPRPTQEEIKRVGHWVPWSWQKAENEFLIMAQALGFEI